MFVCLIKGLLSWWGGKKRAPHEGSSCAVHICKTHQFIPVCWLSESGSVILLTANSNDSSAQCHVSHFIKMDLWNEGVCIFLVLRDFTLHYSCTPNEQCESLFSFWTFSILQLCIFGPVNFCHLDIKRPYFGLTFHMFQLNKNKCWKFLVIQCVTF